jgi:hypothetical protein
MVANRGEDPKILALRWDRYLFLKANHDFVNDRAFQERFSGSRESSLALSSSRYF